MVVRGRPFRSGTHPRITADFRAGSIRHGDCNGSHAVFECNAHRAFPDTDLDPGVRGLLLQGAGPQDRNHWLVTATTVRSSTPRERTTRATSPDPGSYEWYVEAYKASAMIADGSASPGSFTVTP